MTWSSLDLAGHCRADIDRTTAFEIALRQVISSDDVVLDIGAGSGVLSVLAVRCGAKRVIAVESDQTVCSFLRQGINQSGCPIELICSEASAAVLPVADVVLAELVDVWLLEEDFAGVISSLAAKGTVVPRTKIVPCGYKFDIAFGNADWGVSFPEIRWPHYQWPYYDTGKWARPSFTPLVEFRKVHSIASPDLVQTEHHLIDFRLEVSRRDAEKLAFADVIRLSGTVALWGDIAMTRCGSMNAPILIPVAKVSADDWTKGVRVTARLSGGIRSLRVIAGERPLFGDE